MSFFSVIISTYNRVEMVLATIRSILSQSFEDFEIVVVDDGSLDNTKEILDKEFCNNPKVHLLYQTNAERGAARNNGIKNAKGRYFVFIDSDDLMKENHLSALHTSILLFPTYKLYATRYEFFNEKGVIKNSCMPIEAGSYEKEIFLNGNPFAVNFCIGNDANGICLFESDRSYSTMEDWIFLIENLSNNKLLVIEDVTILMRDHSGRSMNSEAGLLSSKRILATERIIAKVTLTEIEKKKLWGGTYRFCAVHYYIDYNRMRSLHYWKLYVTSSGLSVKALISLIKFIIGKKVIRYIQ